MKNPFSPSTRVSRKSSPNICKDGMSMTNSRVDAQPSCLRVSGLKIRVTVHTPYASKNTTNTVMKINISLNWNKQSNLLLLNYFWFFPFVRSSNQSINHTFAAVIVFGCHENDKKEQTLCYSSKVQFFCIRFLVSWFLNLGFHLCFRWNNPQIKKQLPNFYKTQAGGAFGGGGGAVGVLSLQGFDPLLTHKAPFVL